MRLPADATADGRQSTLFPVSLYAEITLLLRQKSVMEGKDAVLIVGVNMVGIVTEIGLHIAILSVVMEL